MTSSFEWLGYGVDAATAPDARQAVGLIPCAGPGDSALGGPVVLGPGVEQLTPY